jgi:CHAT domain-containing protein
MREIRMDASRDSAEGSWAHPFYWAPFVLIGDGGGGR